MHLHHIQLKKYFSLQTDIPIWLKSLRLHKYQYVFESLSYDEMMDISDETLTAQVRKSFSYHNQA